MNNKGQTLVLFVLILPLILFVIIILINNGILNNQKIKLENNIKSAIQYGLNLKIVKEDTTIEQLTNNELKIKIENLLRKNIDCSTLNVVVNDNNIEVNVVAKSNSLFKVLTNLNDKFELNYYGYIENNKIKIVRR